MDCLWLDCLQSCRAIGQLASKKQTGRRRAHCLASSVLIVLSDKKSIRRLGERQKGFYLERDFIFLLSHISNWLWNGQKWPLESHFSPGLLRHSRQFMCIKIERTDTSLAQHCSPSVWLFVATCCWPSISPPRSSKQSGQINIIITQQSGWKRRGRERRPLATRFPMRKRHCWNE